MGVREKILVVLRYQSLADLLTKLQVLGVAVKQPVEGETLQIEGHFERCNTPEMVTTAGRVISVLASPESAAIMSDIMPPEVLVDYIEGEMEQVAVDGEIVEQPIPWPEYDVNIEDGEGRASTVKQSAGRIQV